MELEVLGSSQRESQNEQLVSLQRSFPRIFLLKSNIYRVFLQPHRISRLQSLQKNIFH